MLSLIQRGLRSRGALAAVTTGVGLAGYCVARTNPSFCDAGSGSTPAGSTPAGSTPTGSGSEATPAGGFGSVFGSVMSAFDSAKQAVHDNLVAPFTEASQEHLLPGLPSRLKGKELPTLVIALDDVILHSTWDRQYGWRYMKRPGVDEFLRALSPYYEIVVWTEQFSLMEPVISSLDKHQVVRHRLYKDGMVYRNGRHVKDLKHLNRQLSKTVVIDCNKRNTSQQPENYLLVTPFTGEAAPEAAAAPAASEDDVLVKHIPFLVNLACLAYVKGVDVREELKRYEGADVPAKFADEVRQIKGGRGTRASATGAVTGTPTVWERMRSSRGSS